MLEQIDVETW